MLDPISALRVAAAVLQFVGFGNKVLATAWELSRSAAGATKQNADLDAGIRELEDVSKVLSQRVVPLSNQSPLPPDVVALQNLATECQKHAADPSTFLQSLKVEGTGVARSLSVFKQSIKTVAKTPKIKREHARLKEIQEQLNTRSLGIIR